MNDSWDRFGKESDEVAMHEDDVFEATQTGPATQPQSLPTGTQDSQLDHCESYPSSVQTPLSSGLDAGRLEGCMECRRAQGILEERLTCGRVDLT